MIITHIRDSFKLRILATHIYKNTHEMSETRMEWNAQRHEGRHTHTPHTNSITTQYDGSDVNYNDN